MSRKIFIFLIMAAVLLICSAQQVFCESESEKAPKTMKEHTFRDFQIRIYVNDGRGRDRLEILKKGRRIYEQQAERRFLFFQEKNKYDIEDAKNFIKNNMVHPKDAYEPIAIGRDITGRGIPNLVIIEWTGGMRCCFKIYVFELGERIKTAAVLDGISVDFSHFADLDGDSVLEFITFDWTFACWNTSCADSPAPKIILRFNSGKYVIAEKLMRKPAPSAEELEAKAQDVHKVQAEYSSELSKNTSKTPESYRACFPSHEYSPILWETMLDLIYTGNMDAAWKFFDKAWIKRVKGKDKFLREFREQLKTSPYWSEIEKMNAR